MTTRFLIPMLSASLGLLPRPQNGFSAIQSTVAWVDQWAGPIALQLAVAATLMLLAALLASWALRRSAASLRHRVWALAVLGLLAYPLVQPFLPKFSLGLPVASPASLSDVGPIATRIPESASLADRARPLQGPRVVDDMAARGDQPTDPLPAPKPHVAADRGVRLPNVETPTQAFASHWPSVLAGVWAIGVAIGLVFLVNVHWRAYRLVRTATMPGDPAWTEMASVLAGQLGVRRRVAVRISDRIAVSVTAGWFRRLILLPTECEGWTNSQRRMVLIHELSHVARGDVLWQVAAQMAGVIYWPHPLVWLAARRMRVEREAACDDAVLRNVERPSEYASLLLDVAASLVARPVGMSTAAIAMACGRSVEERIRWIVQPDRCRLPLGRRTSRWSLVGAVLLVLGLGSISLSAAPPAPTAPDASSAEHKKKLPSEAGKRGDTPEAEKKYRLFATLECSGASGGDGGLGHSTGFTFVKTSEPNAKKTRLIVSFASDERGDDVTKYRVVAIGRDGRSFANESFESCSGRGRRTGVMTIICEFPAPDDSLKQLRIERLEDAKPAGQSKGQDANPGAGGKSAGKATARFSPTKNQSGEMVLGARPQGKCSISGKVVSEETGKPIAGARMYLFYIQTYGAVFVNTNSDGEFIFKDLPPGPFLLQVSHTAGYQDTRYNPEGTLGPMPQFSLNEGEQRSGIVLKAKTACRVSGKLRGDQGEMPNNIGTYEVLAWIENEGSAGYHTQHATVNHADGSYVIDGLSNAPVYVMAINWRAAKQGKAWPAIYHPSTFSRDDAKRITFDQSPHVENVDITLRKSGGIVLEGTVRDGEGKPVPDAFVAVDRRDMLFDFNTAYTDAQGHYEIQGLGPGQFAVHVDAVQRGLVRTRVPITLDKGIAKAQCDFTLNRGVLISGKLVDGAGNPWHIGRSNGHAIAVSDKNDAHPEMLFNSFSLTAFRNKYRPECVEDSSGGSFLLGDGDYAGGEMLFPTTSTFVIQGVKPGHTVLGFSPQKEDQKVLRILYAGEDLLKSGIETTPGQELKDVTIVIGTDQGGEGANANASQSGTAASSPEKKPQPAD